MIIRINPKDCIGDVRGASGNDDSQNNASDETEGFIVKEEPDFRHQDWADD